MNKAIFYHAGCPVCLSAEQQVVEALDKNRLEIDIVHLGEDKTKISAAEKAGIKSVPALLLNGSVFHINFGASLDDVKGVV
ncbi:thioredoxin family protein [Candidatus Thioglobus sp.]|uniref:thioredoxin family protein n=1 Tax=Candidatus Thioglobus sp. TaxID=2026721 RepID=UPI003D0AB62D